MNYETFCVYKLFENLYISPQDLQAVSTHKRRLIPTELDRFWEMSKYNDDVFLISQSVCQSALQTKVK